MPETLKMLAHHYEARQNLIRQARSAMIYPIAVLVIASAVVALLSIWLLPMFTSLLRDIAGPNADLPLPSRVLMAFSGFVQSLGWWLIPLCMVGLPILLFQFYRTRPGKALLDRLILYVPVFGKLLRKIDTTRFARTLATLLGAGVDVGTSIDLTADVMQLDPMREAVRNAKSAVMDGSMLSESLDASRRFGPDVIAVIESGEETGKVPEALGAPGRRLRGTGRLHGPQHGPARPASTDDLIGWCRFFHHSGRDSPLHLDPQQPCRTSLTREAGRESPRPAGSPPAHQTASPTSAQSPAETPITGATP